MIALRPMTHADLPAVRGLRVTHAQEAFVDPIAETLGRIKTGEDCHVVVAEAEIAGFFIVDRDFASRFDFALPGDLGLQEYFIDTRFQGKGYGKAAVSRTPAPSMASAAPDRSTSCA